MTESPWTFGDESQTVGDAAFTLVDGTTFAIGDRRGDLGGGVEGVFVADTRVCSRLQVLVDGLPCEALAMSADGPSRARFVGRSADRTVIVRRSIRLVTGAVVEVELLSRTARDDPVEVVVAVGSDLADVFAVKEGRATGASAPATATEDGVAAVLGFGAADAARGACFRASPIPKKVDAAGGAFCWRAEVSQGRAWRCRVEVVARRDGEEVALTEHLAAPPQPLGVDVTIDTDVPALGLANRTALVDLGALVLQDPANPSERVVAAGAPWFMTLFGRDSILTAWMARLVDAELGLSTARTLARLQGTRHDPATEEEPGRIVHELRYGTGTSLALADADRYYGTVDATPLFVMLVHELWRWGAPWADVSPLLPAVDAALAWLAGPGDPDGDGFVEYQRTSEHGLVSQGWKDSWDAIAFADGSLAAPPIALAEVQGYAYAAWRAGSALAAAAGDHRRASERNDRASALQVAFDDAFWLPEQSWYALALDRAKRPVDALASNLGHLLWTGIVPAARLDPVARALLSPELASGWGLRTLATTMARGRLGHRRSTVGAVHLAFTSTVRAGHGRPRRERRVTTITFEWEAPNPGPWQQDSAHNPVAQSALLQHAYPEGFNRGFEEAFEIYGVLLDRLAMASINGFTYHQPQPFDLPGPDGPKDPAWIGAELGRRLEVAAGAFAGRIWREAMRRWDEELKPASIAEHRALDVDLAALDDPQLQSHIEACISHVTEMVYQHHRHNTHCLVPVGDFLLQTAAWVQRPPHTLLSVFDGHSPVSSVVPPEMRPAVEALRGDDDARALLDSDGDPAEVLERLRAQVPEVDEYVKAVHFRLLDGFDVTCPTIGEGPEGIVGRLQSGLVVDLDGALRRSDAFAAELRAAVPEEHRSTFDDLLAEARLVYRLRDERGLYSEISAIGLLRLALLELGRRLEARGRVRAATDLLEVGADELGGLFAGAAAPTADELQQRAIDREARTLAGAPRFLGPPPPAPPPPDALPPPLARVMSAVGFLIDGILGQKEAPEGDATTIIGIGGSPGVFEGPVRLVRTIDDLFDLEPGDVLVTPTTGEAFNSMLHLVAAIVTDHGSFASHAAIVSREMGIPAVVGTCDGTKRLASAKRVRVDGSTGEVTILE